MTAPLRGGARLRPAVESVRDLALAGLRSSPKMLPPSLFYDPAGAELFDRICDLDEYYLTRAELEILAARAGEVATLVGPHCALVEYGSGAGRKVRLLLDALDAPAAYLPIDVSRAQLLRVARSLRRAYPAVDVRPIHADYTARLQLPPLQGASRHIAFFPGSTIGNLHPPEATAFLQRVRHTVGPTGALVLGVDRIKDAARLHAAYNDRAGVTAAFNRNILARLNREAEATFDLTRFAHRAFFDVAAARIEMHLESLADQTVMVAGTPIDFARGETIWTECSYKYDRPRLEALVRAAGFTIERLWTDRASAFYLALLTP